VADTDMIATARRLLDLAHARGADIALPTDVIVAHECTAGASAKGRWVGEVAGDEMILDIGPATIQRYARILASAKTILWNGPVGVFEFDQFGEGTRAIATTIAGSEAFSLAGGGDTLAAMEKYGVTSRISYISTGGGAFLEFVEGRTLPAVAILEERAREPPPTANRAPAAD
jgi:phosphoglycerate kinase